MRTLFSKAIKVPKASKLENITIRGLGGGWNAVDDDLSMQPRFQKSAINFRRTTSGSQKLRFGSDYIATIAGVIAGDILDMEYFNGRLIVVGTEGEIATVTEGGLVEPIWNAAIASALPSAPSGWSSNYVSVDFVPFKSEMIIHNGTDKPITINSAFAVTYLQDLASGSNLNVPIGKYGCIASNYHCVAGLPSAKTTVYISNAGTAGTFPGDADPNDAISIDVGAYAPEGAAEIRGVSGFRNYLIIHFAGQSLVVTLGNYNEAGVHAPEFPDTLPQFGLAGHRCVITLENDLVFGSLLGIHSAKRNLFSGQINSASLSALIEPEYVGDIDTLTDEQQLYGCFALHDHLMHDIWFFTPVGRVFVYSSSEQLRYKAWSSYEFLQPWTAGCTSQLGRLFLASGKKIFQAGNGTMNSEEFYADRMNDFDVKWEDETAFTIGELVRDTITEESYRCAVTHNKPISGTFADYREASPTHWELYEGDAIEFELEFPWLDGKDPMKTKNNRFVRVGTRGSAEFTLQIFVDDLYKDDQGTIIHDPALELVLIGNQARGFGVDAGPFGGGRRSNTPILYKLPVRFQMMKPKIVGSTRRPLEIATLSFLFSKGRYKR